MPSVGTAYVNIRVSPRSFETSLNSMLARISKKMDAAGTKFGKDFENGLKKSDVPGVFDKWGKAAEDAGKKVEGSLKSASNEADNTGRSINTMSNGVVDNLKEIGQEADSTSKKIGGLGGASNRASRSLSGIGRGGGGGLRSGGDDAGFFAGKLRELSSEASAGTKILSRLHNMAAFGGTAFAGLAGAAIAAGQSLFAIGSYAAAATPAVAGLINVFAGLAQIGGVVAIAMHGVGAALTAGFKSVDATAKAAAKPTADLGKATAAAARAVRDAKQALQDAYRDAARSAEEAARRTARAEQDLADAQRQTAIAQRNLNEARKVGLEQLEDIAFAAEDAALGEQRAGLDLEDAYNRLQAVSELAPDNRARIEAELAFKEAELHLREAKDHREDADRDQKKAAKSGVEGTDAMISARNDLADAQKNEADASRALSDARREEAQTAEDNARRIRDAQQGVADAEARLAEARKDGTKATKAATTAVDNYAAALAKLSPQQQIFVKKIMALRERFKGLRDMIADPLFKGLNKALDMVTAGNTMEHYAGILSKTSGILGNFVVKAAGLATSPAFTRNMSGILESNNRALVPFGDAMINLAAALAKIGRVAGPILIEPFAKWTKTLTAGWRESVKGKEGTDKLTKAFTTAKKVIKEIAGLFKQAARTIRIFGGDAFEAANKFRGNQSVLDVMTKNLKKFNDAADDKGKGKKRVDGFRQALENMASLGKAIGAVFGPFIKLGADPKIGEAFDKISKSDAFQRIADTSTTAVPLLADLFLNIADIVAVLSETGSIDQFLSVLVDISGALADVAGWLGKIQLPDWLGGNSALKTIGFITGTTLAIKLLWKAFKIGASPFVNIYKGGSKVATSLFGATKKAGGLGRSMKDVTAKTKDSWNEARKGDGVFKTMAGKAKTSISGLATSMKNSFANLRTRFGNIFRSTGKQKPIPFPKTKTKDPVEENKAKTAGKAVTDHFAAGIRAGLPEKDAAMKALEANVLKMLNAMAGPTKTRATGIGKAVTGSLATGVREGIPGAEAAGKAAGDGVVTGIRNGTGIHSPSPELISVGNQMMSSVTIGMEEGLVPAEAAAVAAGTSIATGIGTGASVAAVEVEAAMLPVEASLAAVAGEATIAGVAMEGTGVMARIGSVGVRAFSGAMSLVGGPFGLIMLLLPFLIPLLKKLDDKFHIMHKTLDGLKFVLKKAGDFFTWLWKEAIQPAFEWIKQNWPLLLAILTGPIGIAVLLIRGHFDDIIKFVKRVPGKIKRFLRHVWDIFSTGLSKVWDKVRGIWNKITTWVKGRPGQFVRNLKALWNIFRDGLRIAWDKVQTIWGRVTTWVKGRPGQFKRNLAALWNVFKDKLGAAWNWVKDKWDDIKDAISKWPGQISDKLKSIWNGLKSGFRSAANWVMDKIQKWLINPLNKILGTFGVAKIQVDLPQFAEGGPVRGAGGPKSDKIVARLSNGEHVWTAAEVRAAGGHARVSQMRKDALGTGGLGDWISAGAHWVGSRFQDLTDAIKEGEEAAYRWVLDKFKDVTDKGGIIAKMVVGMVGSGAQKILSTGKEHDDARAAAAAAAAASSGSGPAAVWRALRSVGFNKVQTAGIMGNMQSESGFDPFIVQGGGHSMNPAAAGGGGYGLVQWTPGRKLIPYLHGKKPSINTEITALAAQLAGRGASAEGAAGRALRAADTVVEATRAFELKYERHAGGPQGNRITQAVKWYNKFKGSDAMSAAAAVGYTGSGGAWVYVVPKSTHTYNFGRHSPSSALDLGVHSGTAVHAATAGSVAYVRGNAGSHSSYGYWLVLNHKNGLKTLYAHMSKILKKSGNVSPGQLLGYSGASGGVTGPHLHLEITYRPGSSQSSSTHSRAAAHGLRWPYKYGGAWATGGVISPNKDGSGVMALIAEAGRAERVSPLDSDGFTAAERKIIETLEAKMGGGGGGDTIHVHPSQKMDEAHLADLTLRRMAWKRRRGAGRR